MEWILRNHIKTRREFRIFYKKGIGVLLKIILGNIKKEKLNLKESVKVINKPPKPVTSLLNYFSFFIY